MGDEGRGGVSGKSAQACINILMDSYSDGMSHTHAYVYTRTHKGEFTCNPVGGERRRVWRGGGLKFLFILALRIERSADHGCFNKFPLKAFAGFTR